MAAVSPLYTVTKNLSKRMCRQIVQDHNALEHRCRLLSQHELQHRAEKPLSVYTSPLGTLSTQCPFPCLGPLDCPVLFEPIVKIGLCCVVASLLLLGPVVFLVSFPG